MKWTSRGSEREEPDNLDDATEMALRDGLRKQPAPTISPDFDAHVLRAVHGRSPFWDLFLASLRPALATAAVSTIITTLLVSSHSLAPDPAVAASSAPRHNHIAQDAPSRARAMPDGSYIAAQSLRAAAAVAAVKTHRPRHPGG
jgi:hypothetical protein